MKDFLLFIGAMLVLFALVSAPFVGFAMWADEVGCHARWSGSPFEARWSLFGGCQIRKGDAPWMPAGIVITEQ